MPTLEEELEIAKRAIGEGDLSHAAVHLASAVEIGPDRENGRDGDQLTRGPERPPRPPPHAMSPIVHMCIAEPIAHLALRLPGFPELQAVFLTMRRKLELGRA